MTRRGSVVAGALALGLVAAATARAQRGDEVGVARVTVPPDRTTLEVLSTFAAEVCRDARAEPRVDAGAEAPTALEHALLSATRARMPAAPTPPTEPGPQPSIACSLLATRRARALVLEVRATGTGGERAIARAEVPWNAELAALAGGTRSIAEPDIRASSVPLEGLGYVTAVATPAEGGGALLYAVRATGIDVYRLSADASGRVRASRIAAGERLPGDPSETPPRRPVATAEARGAEVVVTWADLRDAQAASIDGGSLRFVARTPCAALGHRAFGRCAVRVAGRDYFASRLVRDDGDLESLPSAYYARVEAPIRGADGVSRRVTALVTVGGRLLVRVEPFAAAGARRARRSGAGVPGHGLAIAMADLDLDGEAEVLASSDRPHGEGDRLTLYRVRSRGTVLRLWRGPEVAGSVAVATSADVDDDGREELLAIEERPDAAGGARLWIVR